MLCDIGDPKLVVGLVPFYLRSWGLVVLPTDFVQYEMCFPKRYRCGCPPLCHRSIVEAEVEGTLFFVVGDRLHRGEKILHVVAATSVKDDAFLNLVSEPVRCQRNAGVSQSAVVWRTALL